MTSKFLSSIDYSSEDAVLSEYPDAVEIVSVDGGFMIFPTTHDYLTWLRQV